MKLFFEFFRLGLHKTVMNKYLEELEDLVKEFFINKQRVLKLLEVASMASIEERVKIYDLLEKIGDKKAAEKLKKGKFIDVRKKIQAIEAADEDSGKTVEISLKTCKVLRSCMRNFERDIFSKLPSLVREQALISLVVIVEAFILDLIKLIYKIKPNLLGSSKKTSLNDQQLVKAITEDNVLNVLIEKKLIEMSFSGFSFTKKELVKLLSLHRFDFGLIEEMFLVRNCLVHNKRRADAKLAKLNEKYIIGKELVLTKIALNKMFKTSDRLVSTCRIQMEKNYKLS